MGPEVPCIAGKVVNGTLRHQAIDVIIGIAVLGILPVERYGFKVGRLLLLLQ